MTVGDKIRQMTDEEIAAMLCAAAECSHCAARKKCRWLSTGVENGWLKWLREEAAGNAVV